MRLGGAHRNLLPPLGLVPPQSTMRTFYHGSLTMVAQLRPAQPVRSFSDFRRPQQQTRTRQAFPGVAQST